MDVHVFQSREEAGRAAAERLAEEIRRLSRKRKRAAGLFASAPSQAEALASLTRQPGIDWSRLTVFHLDEYLGFDEKHPQSFRRFLREHLVDRVGVGCFHGICGEAAAAGDECARYAELLRKNPPDFALIGIGENGHLAFNDPPVADFRDPLRVKVVELDARCRRQQVNDGLFGSLEDVPTRAITLTIPEIFRVPAIFVVVPGSRKREAVEATLFGEISEACPASILRAHERVELFLDVDSAPPGWRR